MLEPPGTIGLVSAESIFGQTENGPWTILKSLNEVSTAGGRLFNMRGEGGGEGGRNLTFR